MFCKILHSSSKCKPVSVALYFVLLGDGAVRYMFESQFGLKKCLIYKRAICGVWQLLSLPVLIVKCSRIVINHVLFSLGLTRKFQLFACFFRGGGGLQQERPVVLYFALLGDVVLENRFESQSWLEIITPCILVTFPAVSAYIVNMFQCTM